jgi:hypothetical protein
MGFDFALSVARVWSRQSSAPMMMKRKSSKFWPTHLLGGANNVHSGTKAAEEVNTAVLIHQSLESEDTDRETLHLLISLLMHFMANLAKVRWSVCCISTYKIAYVFESAY